MNAGSSSLRLASYEAGGGGLVRTAEGHVAGREADVGAALAAFLGEHRPGPVDAFAHRVVHGGKDLVAPCRIDAPVEDEIRRLVALAPLHNPRALEGIAAARAAFPRAAQVAVFDTGFYADLPPAARTYALPRDIAHEHGIRRFGFHGIAHEAMNRRWRALHPDAGADAGVISLQLGAGSSVTATRGGRAVETSMGFSPLEGLVMATRCGDLDPGVVLYLQRALGMDADEVEALLTRRSGLLGLGGSADMRALLASDDADARLAVDVYCHRARKYIGAYLATLGGARAILFGGGVGENAPAIRERILGGLERFGIALDPAANRAATGTEAAIGRSDADVEVRVVPVDEAAILAESAVGVLHGG